MNRWPKLYSARLKLRPLLPQDAPLLATYRNDPVVARYQGWALPYSVHDARQLVAGMEGRAPGDAGWVQIGVQHRETGVLLGDVAIHTLGLQAELGVTLTAEAQGRGYASEALGTLVAYAFQTLELHRLTGEIDPRNSPVARLLLSLGFRHLETHPGSYLIRGSWTDNAVYELTREQWHAQRKGRSEQNQEGPA